MNKVARLASFTALTCVALGVQGCAQPNASGDASPPVKVATTTSAYSPPPSKAPTATTSPAAPATAKPTPTKTTTKAATGDAAVLAGKRQIELELQEADHGSLRVNDAEVVELSAKYGDRALFVLTPVSGKHQIKTAKLRAGGEPYCLAIVDRNPQQPLGVNAVGCDASASNQLFSVKKSDVFNGTQTWSLNIGDDYVQWFSTGSRKVVAEVVSDSPLSGHFTFTDRGEANLPILD